MRALLVTASTCLALVLLAGSWVADVVSKVGLVTDQATILEGRGMQEWWHLNEAGGYVHIVHFRAHFESREAYQAAIAADELKYPPNSGPPPTGG